jgi:hypothetical protein
MQVHFGLRDEMVEQFSRRRSFFFEVGLRRSFSFSMTLQLLSQLNLAW